MKIRIIIAATIALCANACVSSGEDEGIPLLDPLTGETVGFIDAATGDYHLDDVDHVIPEDAIDRTWTEAESDAEHALGDGVATGPSVGTQKSLCESAPGQTVCMEPDGSSCWVMWHCDDTQCVKCEGCCKKTGPNTWLCWEICTDTMTSATPTKSKAGHKGGFQDGEDIVLSKEK